MPQEPQLTFTFEYKNPVLVSEFCEALEAVSDEYNRFKSLKERPDEDAYDLYITKISEGSIVAHLLEWAPYAMTVAEGSNTVFDFVKNWSDVVVWLKERTGKKPEMNAEQLENAIRLVNPVTRDLSASVSLTGNTFNAPVNIYVDSKGAATVKASAESELAELGRASLEIKQDVVLRWYQARNDPNSKSGDRAIVDDLYPKSVRTTFISKSLKAQLIDGTQNPFHFRYRVNLGVEAIGGRPIRYQIIDILGIVR